VTLLMMRKDVRGGKDPIPQGNGEGKDSHGGRSERSVVSGVFFLFDVENGRFKEC